MSTEVRLAHRDIVSKLGQARWYLDQCFGQILPIMQSWTALGIVTEDEYGDMIEHYRNFLASLDVLATINLTCLAGTINWSRRQLCEMIDAFKSYAVELAAFHEFEIPRRQNSQQTL